MLKQQNKTKQKETITIGGSRGERAGAMRAPDLQVTIAERFVPNGPAWLFGGRYTALCAEITIVRRMRGPPKDLSKDRADIFEHVTKFIEEEDDKIV